MKSIRPEADPDTSEASKIQVHSFSFEMRVYTYEALIIVTYGVAQKELKFLEKELASISQEAVQNCFFVCVFFPASLYM